MEAERARVGVGNDTALLARHHTRRNRLVRLNTPFLFTGLPWNLDRRLSPGGCLPTGCDAGPQPLTPFPFEGLAFDPRTQAIGPVGTYNDPNYTASVLTGVRNRMLSYVSGTITPPKFNGDSTVLAWPPVDPAAIPLTAAAPVITSTPLLTAAVGAGYGYDVNAVDAPADVLTYSLPAAPLGMAIDPATGLIAWTPTGVGSFPVTVQVTDQTALFSTQPFTIVVSAAPVNTSPSITSSPSLTATDSPGDTLIFALTQGPAGMSMSAADLITWTPTLAQVGGQPVSVQVTDQGGLFAQQAFTVTVSLPPNNPPSFTSTPVLTARALSPYSYDANATDPDAGAVLTFSLPAAPAGMTINPTTGVIAWTPAAGQVGANPVTARVTDQFLASADQASTVIVSPTETLTVTSAETNRITTTTRRWRANGTSTLIAGSTITLYVGDPATGRRIGSAVVQANGSWSLAGNLNFGQGVNPAPGTAVSTFGTQRTFNWIFR